MTPMPRLQLKSLFKSNADMAKFTKSLDLVLSTSEDFSFLEKSPENMFSASSILNAIDFLAPELSYCGEAHLMQVHYETRMDKILAYRVGVDEEGAILIGGYFSNAVTPPLKLFFGTSDKLSGVVHANGLKSSYSRKMVRIHESFEQAAYYALRFLRTEQERRVVFPIKALEAHSTSGVIFYKGEEEGEFFVEHVPTQYLSSIAL